MKMWDYGKQPHTCAALVATQGCGETFDGFTFQQTRAFTYQIGQLLFVSSNLKMWWKTNDTFFELQFSPQLLICVSR